MHHWGAKWENIARIGLPGEVLPGSLIPFANLVSVEKVAGVLQQPRDRTVVPSLGTTFSLFPQWIVRPFLPGHSILSRSGLHV